MSSRSWHPPIQTGRSDVLIDGFPTWMREPLLPWLSGVLPSSQRQVDTELLMDFQLQLQADFGFTARGMHLQDFKRWMRQLPDRQFLLLLDYVLWRVTSVRSAAQLRVQTVESTLSKGGSKWSVVVIGRRARVIERVPEGVRQSVSEAMQGTTTSAAKLQEAWLDAFGTKPRASIAYYNAVVAVESAAFAVIPLGTPEPTLANLFSVLEAETPKWKLALRDSERAPGAKSLAAMLRTLWRGHDSRHGAKEYEDVTIEQARAAVMLAATLVWWFRSGVVIPVAS